MATKYAVMERRWKNGDDADLPENWEEVAAVATKREAAAYVRQQAKLLDECNITPRQITTRWSMNGLPCLSLRHEGITHWTWIIKTVKTGAPQ